MKDQMFYIKIVVTIAGSFILSSLLIAVVFPTKTPRVRPNLKSYLTNKVLSSIPKLQLPKINLSKSAPQQTPITEGSETGVISAKEALKDIPYHTVSKGIYVKSDTNFSYTLVKEKEVNALPRSDFRPKRSTNGLVLPPVFARAGVHELAGVRE